MEMTQLPRSNQIAILNNRNFPPKAFAFNQAVIIIENVRTEAAPFSRRHF